MAKKYDIPTIEQLLDAGVHFGHQVKRWHPSMEPYIYTAKNSIHIIDLEKTEEMLKKAADFLYESAKKGGKIVMVGTKKQAREIVEIEGRRSGAMYVTERWLGGTITNLEVIRKNTIDKLLNFKSRKEKGELSMYTKKERLLIDREIERLEKYVGGLTSLKKAPDVVFVIDSKREKTAIKEAKRAKIPVVGLIDTNCNPIDIDYPIPGNDDAIRSIALIVKALSDAIEAGYKDYGDELENPSAKKAETEKKPEVKEPKSEKVEETKPEVTEDKKDAKKTEIKKEDKKEPEAKEEAKKVKTTRSEAPQKEEPKKKRGRPKKNA